MGINGRLLFVNDTLIYCAMTINYCNQAHTKPAYIFNSNP
jgi:hypothetical protein